MPPPIIRFGISAILFFSLIIAEVNSSYISNIISSSLNEHPSTLNSISTTKISINETENNANLLSSDNNIEKEPEFNISSSPYFLALLLALSLIYPTKYFRSKSINKKNFEIKTKKKTSQTQKKPTP